MTFILFLASLALMEYLVRKPRKKRDDSLKAATGARAETGRPASVAASSAGLLALGQALEAHGRGKAPVLEQTPKVHRPPADGV